METCSSSISLSSEVNRCCRPIHSSSAEGCSARIASRPTGDAAKPATSASSGSHSRAARSACSTGDGMGSRSGIVRNNGSVSRLNCGLASTTRRAGIGAMARDDDDQLLVDFGVAAAGAGVEAVVAELPLSAAEAFVSDFVSDLVSDFLSDFPSGLLSDFESESLLRRTALRSVVVHIPSSALEAQARRGQRPLQHAAALGAHLLRLGVEVLDFLKFMAALCAAIRIQRQSSCPLDVQFLFYREGGGSRGISPPSSDAGGNEPTNFRSASLNGPEWAPTRFRSPMPA